VEHITGIQTTPEQHVGEARNQGTTESSHTGLLHTHTAGSADVKLKTYLTCVTTLHVA